MPLNFTKIFFLGLVDFESQKKWSKNLISLLYYKLQFWEILYTTLFLVLKTKCFIIFNLGLLFIIYNFLFKRLLRLEKKHKNIIKFTYN